jgi:hypothetical protein
MLERALVRDLQEHRGATAVHDAEHLAQLTRRPDVRLALFVLAVRIERGRERPLGDREIAQDEVARLARDPVVVRGSRERAGIDVDRHESALS